MPATKHNPWLDALIANPFEQVRALVTGVTSIPQFRAAEPSDTAATLLYGLHPDDPAVRAFDQGVLTTLSYLRASTDSHENEKRNLAAFAAQQLLTVIQRLAPHDTIIDLHCRFSDWNSWVSDWSSDNGLDLRREYWRTLALTQNKAVSCGLPARRLLPLWMEVCSEAGERGRYNDSYLLVGILGLLSLPLTNEDGSIEVACTQGLINWAYAQQPSKAHFLKEWHFVTGATSRGSFSIDVIRRALKLALDDIGRKSYGAIDDFPAVEWLREDLCIAQNIEPATT